MVWQRKTVVWPTNPVTTKSETLPGSPDHPVTIKRGGEAGQLSLPALSELSRCSVRPLKLKANVDITFYYGWLKMCCCNWFYRGVCFFKATFVYQIYLLTKNTLDGPQLQNCEVTVQKCSWWCLRAPLFGLLWLCCPPGPPFHSWAREGGRTFRCISVFANLKNSDIVSQVPANQETDSQIMRFRK